MDSTASLKDIVYDAVLDSIIKDEYKPGRILNEKELVAKFGFSKSPVREALVSLCNEEILKNIPRCGYEVVKLTRQDIEDILQFRLVLESGSLAFSCDKITQEQLDTLLALNALCCDASEGTDMWSHWEHNKEFHLQLISFANNSYAYHALARSMDILKRAYAQFYWNRWNNFVVASDMKSHTPLINALKEHNLAAAQQCIADDLQDFGY
ncbi:MAG: GntR family transcriptional regulator [Ruthenibacterium sp.]